MKARYVHPLMGSFQNQILAHKNLAFGDVYDVRKVTAYCGWTMIHLTDIEDEYDSSIFEFDDILEFNRLCQESMDYQQEQIDNSVPEINVIGNPRG